MKTRLAIALVLGFLALPVGAEPGKFPEIIANQGVAFSLQDEKSKVVTAYDPVDAFNHLVMVADCERRSALFKRVKWCFRTAFNHQQFVNQMTNRGGNKFIPFAGGRCAQGVSNGRFEPEGDPRTAVRIRFSGRPQDERVFLNGSFPVRTHFLGHTSEAIAAARHAWRTAKWLGMIVPNDHAEK